MAGFDASEELIQKAVSLASGGDDATKRLVARIVDAYRAAGGELEGAEDRIARFRAAEGALRGFAYGGEPIRGAAETSGFLAHEPSPPLGA